MSELKEACYNAVLQQSLLDSGFEAGTIRVNITRGMLVRFKLKFEEDEKQNDYIISSKSLKKAADEGTLVEFGVRKFYCKEINGKMLLSTLTPSNQEEETTPDKILRLMKQKALLNCTVGDDKRDICHVSMMRHDVICKVLSKKVLAYIAE